MPPAIHTHEALYGGNPEQLSFVDPLGIMRALGTLRDESAKKGWQIEVTMEATHHGPTSFKIPVVFVEIGSGPLEWSDSTLGEKGAKAAMAAANPLRSSTSNAVGFGGTQYPTKHTRICLEGKRAIGHVISRHSCEGGISSTTLGQVFDKTVGGCETAVVDWRGLSGKQRHDQLLLLEEWSIEVERC